MQQNINGNTPLHIAARSGSTDIVSLFIDQAGNSQVIGEDEDYDDIDVEKGILPAEQKATCKSSVEQLVRIANKSKNTALHEALLCQTDSRISKILRSADPGFEYFANDSGETPLYLAVKFGTPDLVDYMLKICPSQSYGAPGGRTTLHALALRDSDSFKEEYSRLVYLLRHIVKEVDKNGRTALHYAVLYDNNEFLDAVMEVNPSVCYISDKDGMTALHHAAANGDYGSINAMKKMIQHCLDCWEVLDNKGRNFLHVAAQYNNSNVLKYVLNEISSDTVVETIIRMKDKNGKEPCQMHPNFSYILSRNTSVMQTTRDADEIVKFEEALIREEREAKEVKFRNSAEFKETEKTRREQMEYYNQTLLVVSALIATVAFAANFTLPGGYNNDRPDEGMALLVSKPSFIVFIVSNSLAMVLSALAILIQFVGKMVSFSNFSSIQTDFKNERLLMTTIICNLLSIFAMMVAFVAGTYTVLGHVPGLAIPVCILGCIFFVLSFFVIYVIVKWLNDSKDDVVDTDQE
ncbi:uncharacterized protein LOC113362531 [Papaver somniferum]|uniref:uncharacterized protein LOC113362531 n=1 Tax=Papaver somniferum TaxID=3469 RepID=UPI000E6FED4C|nr:uncharacterized protein LOC113362531 [Papaver somniferum]